MTQAIYGPTLIINNVPIDYEPNSLTFDEGKGERKQSPQVSGTDSVTMVYSEDISTKKGMVKFEVRTTADKLEQKREWELLKDANVITIVQNGTSRSFEQAAVINPIEVQTGVDAMMEVVFESLPATL